MADPLRDRPLTIEEYLDLEETSSWRHEYVAGEIYAMAGESRRHNRIVGNIFAHLWAAARGGPCRVSVEGVKLLADDAVYYPDVMVACGPEPADPRLEEAPCLVVEVLSPSTRGTDRREKLLVYKRLPALRAYLIVEQECRLVERHWRGDDGAWRRDTLTERGTIPVPCPPLDAMLTLDGIYEGLALPPASEVLRVREEWGEGSEELGAPAVTTHSSLPSPHS